MVNVDQVAQMTTTITAASTEKTYDTEIGIKEGKYFVVFKSNIYSGLTFKEFHETSYIFLSLVSEFPDFLTVNL